MKEIISEYIIKTESLLLSRPGNKTIKLFLSLLKSLRQLPEVNLTIYDDAIPLMYDAIAEVNNEVQSASMVKLFKCMVDNTKVAAIEAKRVSPQ